MNERTQILQLAYDAGVRGLHEQRQTLTEIRTLAGQGAALGTATSGVLGGLALTDGGWTAWAALAIGGWAAAAIAATWALVPRNGWTFNLDSATLASWATSVRKDTSASLDEAYVNATTYLSDYHDRNAGLLRTVQRAQHAVFVTVAISIVSWLINLAIS